MDAKTDDTFLLARPSPPVLIDYAKVDALAGLLRRRFDGEAGVPAAWDDPVFWNVDASRADRCQFLAVGNAINFRFWSFVGGQVMASSGCIDGVDYQGSMYLWRRLRVAIAREEFSLNWSFLASLTPETLVSAFADDHGRCPLAPGLGDRVENLRDLGRSLGEDWDGQFVNLLDAAKGSLECFAALSSELRAFDDSVRKLTMVNAIMLQGSGLATFDQDPVPGIDYHLVKQAVRQGLVTPPALVQLKLASSRLLNPQEALRLRQATLDALVEVAARAEVSAAIVDNVYWLNRRVCSDDKPACQQPDGPLCPFEDVCSQRTEFGRPLEVTRYY